MLHKTSVPRVLGSELRACFTNRKNVFFIEKLPGKPRGSVKAPSQASPKPQEPSRTRSFPRRRSSAQELYKICLKPCYKIKRQ